MFGIFKKQDPKPLESFRFHGDGKTSLSREEVSRKLNVQTSLRLFNGETFPLKYDSDHGDWFGATYIRRYAGRDWWNRLRIWVMEDEHEGGCFVGWDVDHPGNGSPQWSETGNERMKFAMKLLIDDIKFDK